MIALRPWRSQVRALLGDVTKDDNTIAALVNAFETHGLTLGSTTRRAATDHLGRFRKPELTVAFTNFDQSIRDKVIAVLQKVGGIAPADYCLAPLSAAYLFEFSGFIILHQLTQRAIVDLL
jgi:hypothetical protein